MNNNQTGPKVRPGSSKKDNLLAATGLAKPTSSAPTTLCFLVFTTPLDQSCTREREREREREWPYTILTSNSITVNQPMESDISYKRKGGTCQSRTCLQNGIPRQKSSPIHPRYHFCFYLQDDHQFITYLSSDNDHWHCTKEMCREITMY